MATKKKKVNEGLRGIAQNLIKEQEIERNLRTEISNFMNLKKSNIIAMQTKLEYNIFIFRAG